MMSMSEKVDKIQTQNEIQFNKLLKRKEVVLFGHAKPKTRCQYMWTFSKLNVLLVFLTAHDVLHYTVPAHVYRYYLYCHNIFLSIIECQ